MDFITLAIIYILVSLFILRKFEKTRPWVQIGNVSELQIYPVKGCKALEVPYLECDKWGVHFGGNGDRDFMVVREKDGEFVNAKTQPSICLLQAEVIDGILKLNGPDMEEFQINVAECLKAKDVRTGTVLSGRKVQGYDCGDAVADWLENMLKTKYPIRLLHFVPGDDLLNETPPEAKDRWSGYLENRDDKVTFNYRATFMMLNQSSVDELNTRFTDLTCTTDQFRGNIVVAGAKPHEEDEWLEISIGNDAEFSVTLPCYRCPIVNLDVSNGKRHPRLEPLKSLKQYRLVKKEDREIFQDQPLMGVLMGLDAPGKIQIGDPVSVKYRKY